MQFGPDARFVFVEPEDLFDLFAEIHRNQGVRGHTAVLPPCAPVFADPEDFSALPAPAEEAPAPQPAQPDPMDTELPTFLRRTVAAR